MLNAEDELNSLEDIEAEEIDTEQDYKEILAKIMGQIYSRSERLSVGKPSVISVARADKKQAPSGTHHSTIMLLLMSKLK